MEVISSKITVSGNIVSELSDKIPNNIIALNELIKNAYDAGSPSVDISIDSEKSVLRIRDYGLGMDFEDVNRLFHISSSEKEYGKEIDVNGFKRIVQGSKGLGFLSVFKFGKNVNWKTGKNQNLLEFSLNFSELVEQDDISSYPLEISNLGFSDFIGTEISIDISEYNLSTLIDYFSDEKNLNKVLNSFVFEKQDSNVDSITIDPDFIINLEINGIITSTNTSLKIEDEHKEAQFLSVKFNSKDKKLNFYYKENLIHSKELDFDFSKFSINLSVQIYSLKAYGKSKIDPFFYNPRDEELTPLLYVNNNLFNNYSIFDTGVMKASKISKALPQMIGFVLIKSFDKEVSFNSDRTQFTQNELTDQIIKVVDSLNRDIQTLGSRIRDELKGKFLPESLKVIAEEEIIEDGFSPQSLLNENSILRTFVDCKTTEDKITYTLFGNKISVPIRKKEKMQIDAEFEIFVGQDKQEILEKICELSDEFDCIIFMEETEYDEIDWNTHGEWLLKKETDSQIIQVKLNIKQPEQPKITVVTTNVDLHRVYEYDELFVVENSFGKRDENIKFQIDTFDNPNVNMQKGKATISFDSLDDARISITIIDKTTRLSHSTDEYFRVNDPSKKIDEQFADTTKEFIRMPVSESNNLPSSIVSFILELNSLAENREYSYTFVSSVRTLVELCTIDILNIKGVSKKETLSENYKLVTDSYSGFLDGIEDKKDKQIIKNIIQSVSSSQERESFLAFLNLSTHGSSRIISKSEVMLKTREIGALLEYLSFLSKR